MIETTIRKGGPADAAALFELFDEAISWLVARGQLGQWGSDPMAQRPGLRHRVQAMAAGGGLRVAEHDGAVIGVLVVGTAPSYVPDVSVPELYIELLLSSRRHAGQGIGAGLVRVAADVAAVRGARILRVDCWAGAPPLCRGYERQGFAASATFDLDGWAGQVLTMEVPP